MAVKLDRHNELINLARAKTPLLQSIEHRVVETGLPELSITRVA
jgi:hypothetical protein